MSKSTKLKKKSFGGGSEEKEKGTSSTGWESEEDGDEEEGGFGNLTRESSKDLPGRSVGAKKTSGRGSAVGLGGGGRRRSSGGGKGKGLGLASSKGADLLLVQENERAVEAVSSEDFLLPLVAGEGRLVGGEARKREVNVVQLLPSFL